MEILIMCLLTIAGTLLLYFIAQGNKNKIKYSEPEDPLAGLPDIIGRPKGLTGYSANRKSAQVEPEKIVQATITDNDHIQKGRDVKMHYEDTSKIVLDWKEEEAEMGRYVPDYVDEGFANGITFDELDLIENILENQSPQTSDKSTALSIVSKIDGTQLLGLLENKIGDASRKIALLLERKNVEETDDGSSAVQNKPDNFNIGDYV